MKAGWDQKRLSELLQKTGTTDPTKEPQKRFTYIDVSSVSNETFTIAETSELLGKDAPSRARRSVSCGDVIFATIRPTLKRIAIIPSELDGAVCSTGYFVLRVGSKLDNRFLFYWLFSSEFQAEMEARQKGASYPAVNDSDIRDQYIPLPPLDEQRRIVTVLDKAFANIATVTANAQKNLTNARALFEGYLEAAFSNRGDGWKDLTLGKVCKVERGSSPRPIKSYVTTEDNGQNWIKIGDTKNDSKYVTQTKERITPAGALKSRKVDPGDFILTNSMSFGKPFIMKISGYIHDGWFALRLGEGIDTEYFYYLLSSPIVQKQFQNLAAGAIVLNISGDLVKKAVLPIPPIEQQKEIVKRIQLADSKVGQLKRLYENKLAALTELKQSLLQQAFAGELT